MYSSHQTLINKISHGIVWDLDSVDVFGGRVRARLLLADVAGDYSNLTVSFIVFSNSQLGSHTIQVSAKKESFDIQHPCRPSAPPSRPVSIRLLQILTRRAAELQRKKESWGLVDAMPSNGTGMQRRPYDFEGPLASSSR